jgi:hypothetical protein
MWTITLPFICPLLASAIPLDERFPMNTLGLRTLVYHLSIDHTLSLPDS